MSTREEKKEATKEGILETTLEILLDPEFSNLNTNTLAQKAGVSKGSIFHHFGSKDKLILNALEKLVLDQFKNLMDETNLNLGPETTEPIVILETLTRSNLELIVEHPNLTSLLMQIISDFRDKSHLNDLDDFLKDFIEKSIGYIVPLFKGLGWSEDKVFLAARLYLAILDGLGIQQELERNLPSAKDFHLDVEKTTSMIIGLFDKRQKK